jgi:hypothetical protein
MQSPGLYAAMSAAARRRARETFGFEMMSRAWSGLLRGLETRDDSVAIESSRPDLRNMVP